VPQGVLLGFADICETLLNLKAQYGIYFVGVGSSLPRMLHSTL